MSKYTDLCDYYNKIKHFESISGIMHWDTATTMPIGAAKYRAEDMAALSTLTHEMLISNKIDDLISSVDLSNLDQWHQANVREIKRNRDNAVAVDTKLIELSTKVTTECEMVWREARQKNDYNMLQPYLQKVLDVTKDIAASRADYFNCSPYESLLDIYDPGSKITEIEKIFSNLRGFLPGFIQKVVDKQKSLDFKSFGTKEFSEDKQKQLGLYCMEKLSFDFTTGRLDVSTHPFCGGNSRDVRITTRYDKNNFLSGLMGTIHETGHALYEQNLPNDYKNLPVGCHRSMSIHESQSLLCELQIARSKAFVEFIQPKILEIFEVSGELYSIDNLYNNINRVRPSLIRVDADEVTYPAHVILRFDLEKHIFSGNLDLKDLPQAWSDGMEEMLDIKPDSDANGCMQDLHWPSGIFGYFPSYLLGAILAAQFFDQVKKEEVNIFDDIKQGKFSKVVNVINNKVHSKGCLYSASDLIVNATGRNIDLDCYKQYLENKFA